MKRDYAGERFGNYQLVTLLGRGGFAAVYLGQHIWLKKQAAIKILHASLSREEIAQFQHEAEIITSLDHRNIVRILDFDIAHDIPFLVMDYYPHGTLRRRHPKGTRLPLPIVVSYVKQIAAALQYAHDQRLIHRDIKPENMLIGRDDDILLSDFGIAANAHNTSSMSVQAPMGTIPYMAPEQIQAQARPASDQYALGVVVYEWLAGERPFEGHYSEIFAKHLHTPPPPLKHKLLVPSSEVEQVVFKALTKDPKQRFETVRAFAAALEKASLRNSVRLPPLASHAIPYLTVPTPFPAQNMQQPQLLIQQRQLPPTPVEKLYSSEPLHNIQPAKQVEQQTPFSQLPITDKSSYSKFGLANVLNNWGDLFKYSLPTIKNFSDTLPLYIPELLVSTGIVALWLKLAMHTWNWAIFAGSIGGSILLFLCGFINSNFIKLCIAMIFGTSWGVLLFLLYFALATPANISTPGFMLGIFGIVSLGLFHIGSSIHCYLFRKT